MPDTPISIGSNRQLLLDRRLIDELQDARQVLHQPVRRNAAVRIDHPWEEGGLAYAVLFKDGDHSPSRIVVIGIRDIYPPDAIKRRFGEWPVNIDDFVIELKAFSQDINYGLHHEGGA